MKWTTSTLTRAAFLQRLMVGEANPVFVVVDGHPVHKSSMVRQYIERAQ